MAQDQEVKVRAYRHPRRQYGHGVRIRFGGGEGVARGWGPVARVDGFEGNDEAPCTPIDLLQKALLQARTLDRHQVHAHLEAWVPALARAWAPWLKGSDPASRGL